MRANFLLLLLHASLLIFLANFSSASRLGIYEDLGPWNPIKNPSDPHTAKIGEFAVSEHNKETSSKLAFSKVIMGDTQTVAAGLNYRLVVEAKDGVKVRTYEAVVWEKTGGTSKSLTSFKRLITTRGAVNSRL